MTFISAESYARRQAHGKELKRPAVSTLPAEEHSPQYAAKGAEEQEKRSHYRHAGQNGDDEAVIGGQVGVKLLKTLSHLRIGIGGDHLLHLLFDHLTQFSQP